MWSFYLIRTRSGIIGPQINPSDSSWTMTINETETLDLTFVKSDLPRFETKNWLEPWWSGILMMWDNVPIFAGPLISRPSESNTSLKMAYSGIRALFAKRSCVQDMKDWNDLKNPDKVKDWHYIPPSNTPYATIARNVVENSLRKQGGDLPIVFMTPKSTLTTPDPEYDIAGSYIQLEDRPHYRRFAGYDGLNSSVDLILTDLSELDNGPDIMFRPNTVRDEIGWRVVWEMWSGMDDDRPEIPQTSEATWDTTAANNFVPDMTVRYSGKDMSNRSFGISQNGSGGGSIIAMSQDTNSINEGYPLLEAMESYGGVDNRARVESKAKAHLEANDNPKHQIEGTVRADGAHPIGTFWPGDYGILINKGWFGISKDETTAKILTVSGDLTADIKIGFKEVET